MARWSSGQDGGLSRRKREFDSPTGHHFSSFFNMLFSVSAENIVGVDCDEGPPVPIPNTEVKLVCADDSCRVTGCENR